MVMVPKSFVVVPLKIEINLRGFLLFFMLLVVQAKNDGRSDRRDC